MLRVTPSLWLDEKELDFSFLRAGGPGGQNVNKVATGVELRFDVRHSATLPAYVKTRLMRLAGRRLTQDGVLLLRATRYRTQEQNRADAVRRLLTLLRRAVLEPPPRRPTLPPTTARTRRLAAKKRRAEIKRLRQQRHFDE